MSNIYRGQDRDENEYDPFQNVKATNFDNGPVYNENRQNSSTKQTKSFHPFSRDFVDSMFTVINKDLLFCKLFYFFFFGAFGSLFPLMAIYFKQLGMNAMQSGLLIGFRPFIEFLSAPFWGGLADKWRRGKEMLLFSLLSWIVFTLAIAFVQPPAHSCIISNGTHHVLEIPIVRRRRDASLEQTPAFFFSNNGIASSTNQKPVSNISNLAIFELTNQNQASYISNHGAPVSTNQNPATFISNPGLPEPTNQNHGALISTNQNKRPSNRHEFKHFNKDFKMHNKTLTQNFDFKNQQINNNLLKASNTAEKNRLQSGNTLSEFQNNEKSLNLKIRPPGNDIPAPLIPESRQKRVYKPIDTSKIVNYNGSSSKGLLFNQHSVVVYQEGQVAHAFFILLLLVIVGEFFSAPAVTFADSVTLSFLGEDVQNYGRQRMFGSIGWGLSMFFVGMALDHSTTFPDHPCGKAHIREKNYTVCFAVFSVLMSCAFLAALQFRFDHHSQDIKLSEIPQKVKTKVKRIVSGHRKIDKERLVEEYSDDEDFPPKKVDHYSGYSDPEDDPKKETANLKINPATGSDMVTDALKAPGAKAGRGFGGVTGAVPFGSAEACYSDQPFFGKWFAVMRILATYQYISVLFIAWFMGFGIGIIFTFLFWHLQDLDGSPTLFGVASVINHISELVAYFTTASFIGKYGHVKILYAGLLGNVARFIYISLLKNPWWVMPFEFVQGLTHAAVWAASCAYITHAIPVELRSSAQSIIQGLHHGLGRGCGAVFGGMLVYKYGSVVTFRIYGVLCIFILAGYMGVNYFLQSRGKFSHRSAMQQGTFEDTAHLAPHGVPSGTARDLTSKRLAEDTQQEYGAVVQEKVTAGPGRGQKGNQIYGGHRDDNPLHHGYEGERITSFESPQLPPQKYKKHYRESSEDDDYSP